MDNRTLQLYRDSLEQTEDQIAGLTKRAAAFRQAIQEEEDRRAAKAKKQKAPKPPAEA